MNVMDEFDLKLMKYGAIFIVIDGIIFIVIDGIIQIYYVVLYLLQNSLLFIHCNIWYNMWCNIYIVIDGIIFIVIDGIIFILYFAYYITSKQSIMYH